MCSNKESQIRNINMELFSILLIILREIYRSKLNLDPSRYHWLKNRDSYISKISYGVLLKEVLRVQYRLSTQKRINLINTRRGKMGNLNQKLWDEISTHHQNRASVNLLWLNYFKNNNQTYSDRLPKKKIFHWGGLGVGMVMTPSKFNPKRLKMIKITMDYLY